jgi:hypothetical protein
MTNLPDDADFPEKPAALRSDIRENQVNWDFDSTIRGRGNNQPNLRVPGCLSVKLLENALHILKVRLNH